MRNLMLVDHKRAWKSVSKYAKPLQAFVSSGGHYMGFCLGAYLAGSASGFGLLPDGVTVLSEILQPNSQVSTDDDTVIQVDWTLMSGETKKEAWMFFQEGPFIAGLGRKDERVLARYSESSDVAAAVFAYGKGTVGLVGPHPEADASWCKYRVEGVHSV